MRNLFLIGDSIRFGATNSPGYGIYVKEKLDGVANVYAPNENCRFAQYTLRQLHDWAKTVDGESIDVVHWNNGLWDVLRLDGDEPLTPCDMYVQMLKRIYTMLRKHFPNARIIFANSTSVVEKLGWPNFMRYNAEIEQYNAAAKELMARLGAEVNDLYSVTRTFDDSLRADWVHYNEEGSRILADAVVAKIESVLGEKLCNT